MRINAYHYGARAGAEDIPLQQALDEFIAACNPTPYGKGQFHKGWYAGYINVRLDFITQKERELTVDQLQRLSEMIGQITEGMGYYDH